MTKWYLKCLGLNMYTVGTEIWRDDKGILFERDEDKYRYYITNDELNIRYVEYKEPRKVEGWVNVYEAPEGPRFGAIFKTKGEATVTGNKTPGLFLATIKIIWTEGE